MRLTKDYEKLGLPEGFKFGIEIEAFNVNTNGKNGLYKGESAKYIKSKNWHMATKHEEMLVGKGGAELVSPILTDNEQDYKSIADICNHIKKYPGNKGDAVVADEQCGLHIHFDSEILTKDPNRMRNFKKIYAEAEELLYKMCNDKNDPIRKSAINKDFKGIHIVSAAWRNGMAAPIGKKLLKQIENNTLKVSYKKFGRLRTIATNLKFDERRYAGLNLTNIGNPNKNTIEFRMANGTLDPKIIKQNIFLYASLIDTAIKVTENPDLYKQKLDMFYTTDVTEKEKAENFLNLIMDNPEDRKIYMERWESIKNAPVFQNNYKKGFSQNRFKREDLKQTAMRTPSERVHMAYSKIKEFITRTNNRGDVNYDRRSL